MKICINLWTNIVTRQSFHNIIKMKSDIGFPKADFEVAFGIRRVDNTLQKIEAYIFRSYRVAVTNCMDEEQGNRTKKGL